MKKFFKEFKQFISRGNVLQLAIGVVVGSAFGKITTSLVNDIITPLIASLIGASGFSDLKWIIKPADAVAGTTEIAVKYGAFIQTVLDFLIISFCIFLMMKLIMKLGDGMKLLSNEIKEGLENLSKKDQHEVKRIVKKYSKQIEKIENNKKLTQEQKDIRILELNVLKDEELEKFAKKEAEAKAKLEAEAKALEGEQKKVEKVETISSTDKLLIEIRDLLKQSKKPKKAEKQIK